MEKIIDKFYFPTLAKERAHEEQPIKYQNPFIEVISDKDYFPLPGGSINWNQKRK